MMPRSAAALVLLGATFGLTWAAALRGYMVEVAGVTASRVDWLGTFGAVLAPGLVVGALLGWAEYLHRTGGRRGWRWLAAAPLVFAVAPLSMPGALMLFLTSGLGGGALAVAIIGVLGGYALSGRGPIVARIASGIIALAIIPGWIISAGSLGLAVTNPRGAWVAVLFFGLLFVLALASSIPHRAVVPRQP